MSVQYAFITTWQIKAPIEQVWAAIYETEAWPQWWRGVLKVEKRKEGNHLGIGAMHHYVWKSLMPYRLSFEILVTDVNYLVSLSGISYGELQGTGTWHFESLGNDVTGLQYYWNVTTTPRWMNMFSFLMKPLFKYNHDVVMRWGAEGLAKRLNAELLSY